ncbi:T9SS type A sorting domain-containing protein [bacterium]|nr:T9SS type A sorting domain-containing protein [bacterium]
MRKLLIIALSILTPILVVGAGRYLFLDQGVEWIGDNTYHIPKFGSIHSQLNHTENKYYIQSNYDLYAAYYANRMVIYDSLGIAPFDNTAISHYGNKLILPPYLSGFYISNNDSMIVPKRILSEINEPFIINSYDDDSYVVTSNRNNISTYWNFIDPAYPVSLIEMPLCTKATAIVDDHFYTQGGNTIYVYDATNLESPELVYSMAITGEIQDVVPGWLMCATEEVNGNWDCIFYSIEDPVVPVFDTTIAMEYITWIPPSIGSFQDSLFVAVEKDDNDDFCRVTYFNPNDNEGPQLLDSHDLEYIEHDVPAYTPPDDDLHPMALAKSTCWINRSQILDFSDISSPEIVDINGPSYPDTLFQLDEFFSARCFTMRSKTWDNDETFYFCEAPDDPADPIIKQEIPDEIKKYFGTLLQSDHLSRKEFYRIEETENGKELVLVESIPRQDIERDHIFHASMSDEDLFIVTRDHTDDDPRNQEFKTYRVRDGETTIIDTVVVPLDHINVKNLTENGFLYAIDDTLYYATAMPYFTVHDSINLQLTTRAILQERLDRDGHLLTQVFIEEADGGRFIYNIVNNRFVLVHDFAGLNLGNDYTLGLSPEYLLTRSNEAGNNIYKVYDLSGEIVDSVATFYTTGTLIDDYPSAFIQGDTVIVAEISGLAYFLIEGGYDDDPVSDKQIVQLPSTYSLSTPYPNPFNSTCEIQFELPRKSLVIITLYDILGREIQTVMKRKIEAGKHTHTLNASNMASGIYFIKMTSQEYEETKKIVLLK